MSALENCKLLIATPAYNGVVHSEYTHALLSYANTGIMFSLQTLGNESLITRARNTLISNFHGVPAYTHLLFIDADVYLPADALVKLISHEKDVIGAPVSLKEHGRWNTDADQNAAPGLYSVNRVGTAVFMLSRKAAEALIDDAKEKELTYRIAEQNRVEGLPEIHYDVFRTEIVNNEYLSEDFAVCNRLRNLGFEIFVDTSIQTVHHGTVAFNT